VFIDKKPLSRGFFVSYCNEYFADGVAAAGHFVFVVFFEVERTSLIKIDRYIIGLSDA
jgi:hypothetical protein